MATPSPTPGHPAPGASTLRVVRHPLVQHKLSLVRDRSTPPERMRMLVEEISLLLTMSATRELPTEEVVFHTPLEETRADRIREEDVVVVPILRAGLGMAGGVLRLIPGARVGYLGFERNEETLEARCYYQKLPPGSAGSLHLVVDPMVGTGGTTAAALADLRAQGVKRIALLCLIASLPGASRLAAEHPETPIYAAALDERLDERGYLRPGLGDAGDRLYGTMGNATEESSDITLRAGP